jgi:hypothetical protein
VVVVEFDISMTEEVEDEDKTIMISYMKKNG